MADSKCFPENLATLKLHGKIGFRVIGIEQKVARLEDKWRNIVLSERRRKKVGI